MIIKELRESTGLSQRDLASIAGFSRSKVFDLEQGRNIKKEDLVTLSKIFAKRINMSYIAELFDRASSVGITKIHPYKIHSYQVSPTYISRVMFHSKHEILCNLIMEVVGSGKVCPAKNGFQYYAHCQAADAAVDALLPYLVIKKAKFLILKEFRVLLEHERDKYRATKFNWIRIVKQDTKAPKSQWVKSSAFSKLLEMSNNYLYSGRFNELTHSHNEKGHRVYAPVTNLQEVLKHKNTVKRQPLDQSILDQYETLYKRIKEV
jgi:transcriptional regulator with XRE-family HTH domain